MQSPKPSARSALASTSSHYRSNRKGPASAGLFPFADFSVTSVGRGSGQQIADSVDLVAYPGDGFSGQADAVLSWLVLESRDHVDVEVVHGLECGLAAAVEQVDTIRSKPVPGSSGNLLGKERAIRQVVVCDIEQVV